MEILIVDCKNEIIPGAREGMPNSRTIGVIHVTANNSTEVYDLIEAMRKWAAGTFEDVVVSRPDPDGPIIVSPRPDPPEKFIDIDPITGMPIS